MTKRAFCTGRTDENGQLIITPACSSGSFRLTARKDSPTMQEAIAQAFSLKEAGYTDIEIVDKRGGAAIRPFEPLP